MPLLTSGPSRFLGGGNVTWLLRDEFTSDLAAGAVNGTAAEPGPGTRTVVDTNGVFTITSGKLRISGTVAANDRIVFGGIARVAGRMLFIKIDDALVGGAVSRAGWSNNNTTNTDGNPGVAGTTATTVTLKDNYTALSIVDIGAVPHVISLILRSAGGFYFAKISGIWTYLWSAVADNSATMYPKWLISSAASETADISYIRVPDVLWLPTPLVSDSFSTTFGTSDGLGHAEGIATGIGAGGGGVAWTQQVGTWAVGSAKANAATLSGGIAVATVSLTTANVVMGAACVRSAGEVGVVLSWADSSNYVRALHNGTNVQLIKTVAGTPTTLVNAAATYSAGARLVVTKDGTAYRVYYNNALVGTEQTIADAGIVSNTLHGLFSTDAGNTLDDFVVYARGNEGQYTELDRYSGS